MDCQKNTTCLIKLVECDKYCFKSKEKPKYVKKANTYCLVCKKKTDNKNIKGAVLDNKIGNKNQPVLVGVLKSQLFKKK